MNSSSIILLVHAASTWFMVGLIWLIQLVHYPLFAHVGAEQYTLYQEKHEYLITWIVGPMMLVELVSSVVLLWRLDGRTGFALALTGVCLVAVIWLSTALLQVPCHARLSQGFDEVAHRQLVWSNWLRTVAWSARGILVTVMLYRLMRIDVVQ